MRTQHCPLQSLDVFTRQCEYWRRLRAVGFTSFSYYEFSDEHKSKNICNLYFSPGLLVCSVLFINMLLLLITTTLVVRSAL
jgi:hypothetical protein